MPTTLEQIQTVESGNINRQLSEAQHSLNWAEMFNSTPNAEVLRARRDFTDMVSQAVERKQAIMAQTDNKAAQLYFNTEKFNEWQRQAPLRDQLLQARIDAQGASTRYKAWKESETSKQTTAFFNELPDIETQSPAGTAEHVKAFTGLLAKYPFAASTAEVRDLAKTQARLNDTQATLKQNLDALDQLGMKTKSVDFTSSGGVNVRGTSEPGQSDIEKELHQGYGLTKSTFLNPLSMRAGKIDEAGKFTNAYPEADKGSVIQLGTTKGAIAMPRGEYDRFKSALSGSTPATDQAVKHLGKWNPKTGNFE